MNYLEYAMPFQIAEGWIIDFNAFFSFPVLENTAIFTATNKIEGTEILLEFENEENGYNLNIIKHKRRNGMFSNDTISNYEKSNIKPSEFYYEIQPYLNLKNEELYQFKLQGGWLICKNKLIKDITYAEFDFIFFATKNTFFVDASYENNSFKVCVGISKFPFKGISYSVNDLKKVSEHEFNTIDHLIEFIENYFVNPNYYLAE